FAIKMDDYFHALLIKLFDDFRSLVMKLVDDVRVFLIKLVDDFWSVVDNVVLVSKLVYDLTAL
ncbi:hypothetical protein ACJMK2_022291, partial [Sinanodonta woodiana]